MTCGNCKNGECQTPYSCHVPIKDKTTEGPSVILAIALCIIAGMVLMALWLG